MAQFRLCAFTLFILFTLVRMQRFVMADCGLRNFTLLIIFTFYRKVEANPLRGAKVESAGVQEFPFVVSLGYFQATIERSERYRNHFCGGSLITQRHILTAAHCLVAKKAEIASEIVVTVGSVNLNEGKLYGITTWITYEDWAMQNNISMKYPVNDIAIVVLAKNVTGIVPVVRSNLSGSSIARKKVVTAGWGPLIDNKTTPFLQKAHLRVLTMQECEHYIFKAFRTEGFVPENVYCTSASRNTIEYPVNLSCGDSGGPLISKNTNELIGVNIAKCNLENSDSHPYATNLHANVNYFKDFIDNVLTLI